MEQLPTKEQILEKYAQISYAKGTGIPEAMEEYAAVRAMPLVDMLNKLNNSISNMDGMYLHSVSFKEAMKDLFDMSEQFAKALSSYAGEQPEDEVPDEFVEHHLKRIKELQKELKKKFEAGEQPAQQPAPYFNDDQFRVQLDHVGRIYEAAKDSVYRLRMKDSLDGIQELRNIACEYLQLLSNYPKAGEQPLKSEG